MYLTYLPFSISLFFFPTTLALKIATSLQWIEHTPQAHAIANFYNGTSPATLISGGVANLASDSSIDLAANAETQGLKQYASHKNLRLIYIITEVAYRLVARSDAGITKLSDLRNKKIATIPSTSAAIFIQRLLSSAGIPPSQYTTVSGNVCMRAPCAGGTFPEMLARGTVDAFGVWEPSVELGVRAVGEGRVGVWGNATIYREVYSLYSTTQKLSDPAKRRDILAFVQALSRSLAAFRRADAAVYKFVAGKVGMDAEIVQAVWPEHNWTGTWNDAELMPLLVDEDAMLAQADRRPVLTRGELETFLDASVVEELGLV